MEKDDLKSLVTQIYENLLDTINNQTDPNKEQVVEYLREAVEVVSSLNDKQIDSIEHAKAAFNNAYKEIANKSISSYQHTNARFEQLTQMHEETLNDYSSEMINVPALTEKFNEIQLHMIDEVNKANDIISQLSSQVQTLERDSNIDSLAKVFNRRALSTYLSNICSRKGIPYKLHLIMIDIDDFKVINDTYGHVAGDKVLIFIANTLKKTLRDGDKIFRYGGDEFVLVLNRIDQVYCKKILDRLLELVSKNKLLYKGNSINVTISMGATVFVEEDSPDTLIARADKAVYLAKREGKNTIRTELENGD
ncbi:MAG: diguanylate cyclase [Sulfurimonas sp.]|jgi:diguanylate cyclase|uniref:GGDEF domain-containing protein n=1 Tax=Sulfurimonas sp. TaxID=2022749 RepID=UPI0039E4E686